MDEQAEHIWNNGNYLTTIEYYGYDVNLYSVGKDYYEVYYNRFENQIEKINLVDEQGMKKFLSRIKLEL